MSLHTDAQAWFVQLDDYRKIVHRKLTGMKKLLVLEQNEDNSPSTLSTMAAAVQKYEEILGQVQAALNTLGTAIDHQSLHLPTFSVTPTTHDDLTEEPDIIEDALAQFTPDLAIGGDFTINPTPVGPS